MDVKTDDAEDSYDSDDLFDNVTSPVKNAVKMTIKVRCLYFPIKKSKNSVVLLKYLSGIAEFAFTNCEPLGLIRNGFYISLQTKAYRKS